MAIPAEVLAAAERIRADVREAIEVCWGDLGGKGDTTEDVAETERVIAADMCTVLDWIASAPSPRVFRRGDPEPEEGIGLLDGDGEVETWGPRVKARHGWEHYLEWYAPLVEVPDYEAAVKADEQRRAEK